MALQPVGVQLVADEAASYISKVAAADQATDALGKSAGTAASAINTASRQSAQAARGWEGLGKVAEGAAHRIGHVLVDAAAEAGRAIVQFAVQGVQKAGDFEAKMAEFGAVTGDALEASGKSTEDFAQLFLKLGRELPVSTAEVQQAAIELAKGGIEPATIAAGGLRTALDLAAASGVGISESAEILAKQLGVWVDQAASAGEKSQFLAQAADLLSQAANASVVGVSDLALGLANTGKSADLAGLSFRETVTSMALISSGFSSAADAGTSFKTFIQRLTPATDTQAEAFKKLNLLTAEGKSVFYDTTGSFIGMEQAAELLQQSLAGLSEEQRKTALEAAFGSDAIRAAGMLADAGAEGYAKMAEEMAKVGSVARQAAARQQGFNVAVDNLMGSLEAFQIVAARGVLPLLTKIANALAKGVNAITDYADATAKGETLLAKIATTIGDVLIPAIVGATAASIAYAIANAGQVGIALALLIQRLPIVTAQMWASAAATAAAAAPFVVLGAAVAGVLIVWNKLNDAVKSQTQTLLESREWWNASADALANYGYQSETAKAKLEPYAATIEALRSQIQGEIEDLGRRATAGLVSEQQYATEMAAINQHKDGLIQATAAYNGQEQAIIATAAASLTASDASQQLTQKNADLGQSASLTAKDIEELGKKIEQTYQKGQDAVSKYAATQSEFLFGIEERQSNHAAKIAELEAKKQTATTEAQRKGIDEQIAQVQESYAEQERSAAESYAAQQAAQQQHLGQMLIDYTVAQAQLSGADTERRQKLTALTEALEKEYNLQGESVGSIFLKMTDSINAFAADSSSSIDGLIGTLRDQQQQAADTQHAMDGYAKEYVATAVNNFLENKGDADAYIRSLEAMPKNIVVNVVTRYSEEGERGRQRGGDQGDDPPGRASGGPVAAGQPYLVGERGPELVVPTEDATVIPAQETRRALSGSQLSGMGRGLGSTSIDNSRHISMPIFTNQSPAVLEQSAAIVGAML